MMTRDEVCKSIVHNMELELDREVCEADITRSSCLAVAMEHLGMIKNEELKKYAAQRGGLIRTHYDKDSCKFSSLSLRELLDLLPE